MPVENSIIIGIHGLSKKPSKRTLTNWWKKAICEGLNHNISKYKKKNIEPNQLNFSMVYWNDLMGKNRILSVVQLKKNNDHYQSTLAGDIQKYKFRTSNKLQIIARDLAGDIIEHMVNITQGRLSHTVMRKFLEDLYRYYNQPDLRTVLQAHLSKAIRKHKNKRIMIISHSMGTIIAYDTLMKLNNGFVTDHFITMGSPLGLPFITERIKMFGGKGNPPVPENVKKWTNFSDMHDPVCADPALDNDYKKNSSGIGITDQLVLNDWPHDQLSHKSYGYLRTPEVSKVIAKFI